MALRPSPRFKPPAEFGLSRTLRALRSTHAVYIAFIGPPPQAIEGEKAASLFRLGSVAIGREDAIGKARAARAATALIHGFSADEAAKRVVLLRLGSLKVSDGGNVPLPMFTTLSDSFLKEFGHKRSRLPKSSTP